MTEYSGTSTQVEISRVNGSEASSLEKPPQPQVRPHVPLPGLITTYSDYVLHAYKPTWAARAGIGVRRAQRVRVPRSVLGFDCSLYKNSLVAEKWRPESTWFSPVHHWLHLGRAVALTLCTLLGEHGRMLLRILAKASLRIVLAAARTAPARSVSITLRTFAQNGAGPFPFSYQWRPAERNCRRFFAVRHTCRTIRAPP